MPAFQYACIESARGQPQPLSIISLFFQQFAPHLARHAGPSQRKRIFPLCWKMKRYLSIFRGFTGCASIRNSDRGSTCLVTTSSEDRVLR